MFPQTRTIGGFDLEMTQVVNRRLLRREDVR